MDKQQIRDLEPKYTGNERHLSEGEAMEIIHEQQRNIQNDVTDDLIPIPHFNLGNNDLSK